MESETQLVSVSSCRGGLFLTAARCRACASRTTGISLIPARTGAHRAPLQFRFPSCVSLSRQNLAKYLFYSLQNFFLYRLILGLHGLLECCQEIFLLSRQLARKDNVQCHENVTP